MYFSRKRSVDMFTPTNICLTQPYSKHHLDALEIK